MPSQIDPVAANLARRLRRQMTDGEKRLWLELRQFKRWFGIHVRRQVPIGAYIADFAVHQQRLVIEVDGEHHQLPDRQIRDSVRDGWLKARGYKVVRFQTGELETSFDGCIEEIMRELGLVAVSHGQEMAIHE
ncbi:MAG: DUF559 domain-containing protein [Mesorhizobium sp.]